MAGKLGLDAFDYYMGLGPERSYAKVAAHYGVSKRAVTRRAAKEDWQLRREQIEVEARRKADAFTMETVKDLLVRHARMCRAIQATCLSAMRQLPIKDASVAMRWLLQAMAREFGLYPDEPEALVDPCPILPPEQLQRLKDLVAAEKEREKEAKRREREAAKDPEPVGRKTSTARQTG